eukprot:6524062-Prymnesium_polylepis.2
MHCSQPCRCGDGRPAEARCAAAFSVVAAVTSITAVEQLVIATNRTDRRLRSAMRPPNVMIHRPRTWAGATAVILLAETLLSAKSLE